VVSAGASSAGRPLAASSAGLLGACLAKAFGNACLSFCDSLGEAIRHSLEVTDFPDCSTRSVNASPWVRAPIVSDVLEGKLSVVGLNRPYRLFPQWTEDPLREAHHVASSPTKTLSGTRTMLTLPSHTSQKAPPPAPLFQKMSPTRHVTPAGISTPFVSDSWA
jgi:hypothetical protein